MLPLDDKNTSLLEDGVKGRVQARKDLSPTVFLLIDGYVVSQFIFVHLLCRLLAYDNAKFLVYCLQEFYEM